MKFDFDPFRASVMAFSSVVRVAAIGVLLVALWAAIAWAVALP
ncbi:hypothetical protein [Rhizobium herbae]|uniref:Uncharacterized protein n=1 Tax=Rhizobium herbae TaxID=508661 RepID=A0ABS4EQB7_9HYPH|nr:hypothetical protein [Rhizobium herbae]MBP1860144.1 hypothetical protein [Rhizobium herbae]